MQLFTIFAMIFTAGGVMFALQNNVPVTVNFIIWRFDSTLAMVMLLALVTGGLIVALVSTPATLRRQWQLRSLQKRIAVLEKERGGIASSRPDADTRMKQEVVPPIDPPAALP